METSVKLKFTLILEVSGYFLGQWMYKRIAELVEK